MRYVRRLDLVSAPSCIDPQRASAYPRHKPNAFGRTFGLGSGWLGWSDPLQAEERLGVWRSCRFPVPQQSVTRPRLSRTPEWDWEVPSASHVVGSHIGDFTATWRSKSEEGVHMKNTGKRIFAAAIVFVVANAALLVVAGNLTSQR